MGDSFLNYGSFCTGVGWLDIAFRLGCEQLGITARSVFACEWEAYAAEVLRCRMEEESLEPCPIWCGDLRSFDAQPFRGVVDAAVFGFPCQDISCAGQGIGIHGARSGVFFDIIEACRDLGCGILFMENVSAITTRGMDIVLATLAECGFDAEWTALSAGEVGASHRRERWFCLARKVEHPECLPRRTEQELQPEGQAGINRDPSGDLAHTTWVAGREWAGRERVQQSGSTMAQPAVGGCGELREPSRSNGQPNWGHGDLEHANGSGRRTQGHTGIQDRTYPASGAVADTGKSGRGGERVQGSGENGRGQAERGSPTLFAPGPQHEHWGGIIAHYPHLAPSVEPGFRVLADGFAWLVDESRADQLRCAGNGVVVLQAAAAFVGLMRRVGVA